MIGRRWVLPLAWAALILALTSIPGSSVPDVGVQSADKLVHIVLYAILGALATRAMWGEARPFIVLAIAAAGASVFGAFDELHQSIIPGRSADVIDWVADSIGGLTGAIAVAATRVIRERVA